MKGSAPVSLPKLWLFLPEKMKGNLYMIPNTLGDSSIEAVIPGKVLEIIRELDHFIVENIRTARRFLIKCGYEKPIDDIRFFELNKHTPT